MDLAVEILLGYQNSVGLSTALFLSSVALTTRRAVIPKVHRKAYVMLAMLLVCMTATMVIECQVHTPGSAHEHAIPSRPHHSHDASGHTARVMPCMTAVLPFAAWLIIFTYFWFHITPVVWHYVTPAFPLFIPPRNAARELFAVSR